MPDFIEKFSHVRFGIVGDIMRVDEAAPSAPAPRAGTASPSTGRPPVQAQSVADDGSSAPQSLQ